jgi:hypothetical protein
VRAAVGCVRCDEAATTVVIEFSAVTAYLDLCERHVADLLRGARSIDVSDPGSHRSGAYEFDETKAR